MVYEISIAIFKTFLDIAVLALLSRYSNGKLNCYAFRRTSM